jgi:hypothetical protein
MASGSADQRTAGFAVFKVAVTAAAVVVTLVVIGSWQGLRQIHALTPLVPSVSPVWVVGLIAVCALQIGCLWWTRIALSWWEPILIEAGLCVAFAILVHQVGGTHGVTCTSTTDGPQACMTIGPGIADGSLWGVFAVVGAVLGTVWSLGARSSRQKRAPSP